MNNFLLFVFTIPTFIDLKWFISFSLLPWFQILADV